MVEIERKNAGIEAIRAQGIANANDIINKTLTREYLQHELDLTLQAFAESGANTIVVPANMNGFDMILPTDRLVKRWLCLWIPACAGMTDAGAGLIRDLNYAG